MILATPLFPPEIENISTYSKDLAEKLKSNHQVVVLAYASQVEAISDVTIHTIDKRQPLFLRLFRYFIKLYKLAKQVDIIYVQNSAAVTLPAMLVKKLTKKPLVLNFIEDEAWKRARHGHLTKKSWEGFLQEAEIDRRVRQIFNLQKEALRYADKIIFSSQALAQAVGKSYNLPAVKIAVNYLPTSKIELPFDQAVRKNQILVFGQDFDLAGYQAKSDWKFIVLGHKALAKAEISYLINTSEIIIYNVESENFDNFLIDCVVAGKKILASDTSYAQEIIGKGGVFVDFNDKQAVLEKINKLLGQEIKNTVSQNRFTWKNHLATLQDIFQAGVKK